MITIVCCHNDRCLSLSINQALKEDAYIVSLCTFEVAILFAFICQTLDTRITE